MKKNIFALIVSLFLSLLMLACDDQEKTFFVDGLRYRISSDSTAEVVGDESYLLESSISIPSSVMIEGKEYGITSIGFAAFKECNNLISVYIPSSVVDLGNFTFANCGELRSVTIPSGITSIGECSFANCFNLSNIIIPENVTSIGSCAFLFCSSLTEIEIPDAVTRIEDKSFYNCKNLSKIKMSKNVTSIGADAFHFCDGISSINLPSCITDIGESAFAYCSELDVVIANSEDNVSVGKDAFKECRSVKFKKVAKQDKNMDFTAVPVEEAVSKLKFNVLSNSTVEVVRDDSYENFKTINVPAKVVIDGKNYTVVKIGASAFYKFETMININLPSSITTIGEGAFPENESLKNINVDPENPSFTSINGVLYNKNKTKIVAVPGGIEGKFIIPSSVTCIGNCSFYGCRKLTEVEIPESVSTIEMYAFRNCENLKNMKLPQKLKSIENATFDGCSSLEDIYFPPKLKRIGMCAFSRCSSLTYLMIPPSVKSIESEAFFFCKKLRLLIWNSRYNVEVGRDAFEGCEHVAYEE